MKKPKVIVMDLGGTIIDTINSSFEEGIRYLYDHYSLKKMPYKDVLNEFYLIINECFKKRNNDNFELNFRNCLNYFDKTVGFISEVNFDKLEVEFVDITMKRKKVEGIDQFLEYVKHNNIPLYILSNSCFSSNELKHELVEFNLDKYFNEVFSTADYLMRKPSNITFNLIINYLKKEKLVESSQDIWYIGNDYHFDMVGCTNSFIHGVWLNRKHENNSLNLDIKVVDNYQKLIEILEECNDRI